MTIKLKGSTDGSVSFTAPADTSPSGSDITLTLPTTAGSADQFVKNSGTAGTLEYSSMVETSTGVGIGTSSPSSKLHISASSSSQNLRLSHTDVASYYAFGRDSSGNLRINDSTNGEIIRIQPGGRVGIGTTSPADKLEVAGNLLLDANNARLKLKSGTTNRRGAVDFTLNTDSTVYGSLELDYDNRATDGLKLTSGSYPITIEYDEGDFFRIKDSSTERMRIDSSGNVGIGDTSPDTLLDVGGTATFRRSAGNDQRVQITSTSVGHFVTAYSASGASKILTIQNADTSQPIVFNAGGSERMRINSSGNFGIGTSSPSEKLHVVGNQKFEGGMLIEPQSTGGEGGEISLRNPDKSTTGATIDVSTTNTFRIFQLNNNSVMDLGQFGGTGGVIKFRTQGAERLRIMSDGDIRYNQTSTSTPGFGNSTTGLGVETLSSGAALYVSRNDSGPFLVNRNNDGTVVDLRRSGSQKGNIQVTSSTATFNSASDYRLKENVVAISDGITRLKQLSPSRFNFIEEPSITVDGFIAHEVQAVVPEAVTGTHNEVDDDGNPVMQGMDYGKVTPLLTAALQEAIAKIETLETKVAALEAGS